MYEAFRPTTAVCSLQTTPGFENRAIWKKNSPYVTVRAIWKKTGLGPKWWSQDSFRLLSTTAAPSITLLKLFETTTYTATLVTRL